MQHDCTSDRTTGLPYVITILILHQSLKDERKEHKTHLLDVNYRCRPKVYFTLPMPSHYQRDMATGNVGLFLQAQRHPLQQCQLNLLVP